MLNWLINTARAVTITNPISSNSFADVVKKFAQILVTVGIPLAAIFIVWSGFLFLTARGNDQQLTKAKSTLWWTLVGTAIVVGAYAIASAVVEFAQTL